MEEALAITQLGVERVPKVEVAERASGMQSQRARMRANDEEEQERE